MTALAWTEARDRARSVVPLPPVRVPLADALGRTLTTDLVAPRDIPHYPSSAMDGWAVAGRGPWRLVDDHPDGGQAAPILTGGVVPAGVTGILRTEYGAVRDGVLALVSSAPSGELRPGRHVRPAGGEARTGDRLIAAGTLLSPAHVALAAAAGADELDVAARPRIVVVLTGDEVVAAGLPDAGRVRDGLGPQLPGLLEMLGGRVVEVRRVVDDPIAIAAALAAPADLVVSTGGTGGSRADHLRPVLNSLGAVPLVPRIAMRPGGPALLARLRSGTHVLGLPGNPLAAMMVVVALGVPLLAALAGTPEPAPLAERLAAPVDGRAGSTRLVPARRTATGLVPAERIEPGMMRGLAEADAVLVVPEGGLEPGPVAALALPWR